MKNAFTLAELLITLTIIGVVAALIVPAISNLRPDKNKTVYLQVYDSISETVKSLAANSRLYPVCNNPNVEDNVNCSQYPLLNTSRPLDDRYNNARYQGDRKLCSLIALSLGIAEDDMNCSNTIYAFNAADYTNGFAGESFVTKNGMRWRIVPQIATYTNNFEARFQNDIYVDIDPTNNDVNGEDKSCIFDEENCTQPDIFKFMVGADGKVIPADPMGRLYISGRKSLVRKPIDEDTFEEDNTITANLPARDKVFLYSKCNGEQGSPCGEDETMTITENGIECTSSGNLDEIHDCLENVEPVMGIKEVCGLKMNAYTEIIDKDNDVITIRLTYKAASTLTWKPYVGTSGSRTGQYILSGFSCTIPVGGNTCSIPMSALRAAEQEISTVIYWSGYYSIPPVINNGNYKYIETVFPHYDSQFIYYSGTNTWEYFRFDLYDLPDYQS